MSLLNQRRVRVVYNVNGFFGPERCWEMLCPCCEDAGLAAAHGAFRTWFEAMAWALTHLASQHCLFCIDRQMPAGSDMTIGELFERCPECTAPCQDCHGRAVYPASFDTPSDLITALEPVRLTAIFCDGCCGVVAVVPLDGPEVSA